MQQVESAAVAMLSLDEEIRKILTDCWQIYPESEKHNDAYIAVGLAAVEVGVMLFNVLHSVRNPKAGGAFRTVMDLTVNLNGNPFWAKHGMVLMPLLHIALQAQSDYAILALEKTQSPNRTQYDGIMAETKYVGLEIFVMMAYLLAGSELMAIAAGQLKRRLYLYLD